MLYITYIASSVQLPATISSPDGIYSTAIPTGSSLHSLHDSVSTSYYYIAVELLRTLSPPTNSKCPSKPKREGFSTGGVGSSCQTDGTPHRNG